MNKVTDWSTKKKIIAGVITLVCVGVLVGGGVRISETNKENAKMEQVYKDNKGKLELFNEELIAALDKEDSHYLVKGITKEKMQTFYNRRGDAVALLVDNSNNKLEKLVSTIDENYEKVAQSFDRQDAINTLYQKAEKVQAIDGKELKKDLAIADDLKKEKVAEVKDLYVVKDTKNDYEKVINAFVTTAEDQLAQMDKAKVAVEKVYKDNKIVSTDQKLMDSAKKEVDKIKNDKAKKELQSLLDKVKADQDKKAKEAADKAKQAEAQKQAEEASKAAAEAQAQESAVDTTDNGATGDNTGNGYDGNGYVAPDQGYNNPTGENTGGGYTPPADNGGTTGGGNAAAPSQPSAGGNADGSLTQEQGDQAAKDAANSDWSSFFP